MLAVGRSNACPEGHLFGGGGRMSSHRLRKRRCRWSS